MKFRNFKILDVKTHELLFRGTAFDAQGVYENFCRHKARSIVIGPDDEPMRLEDFESNDPEVREAAFAALAKPDDWIDDESIMMVAEERRR